MIFINKKYMFLSLILVVNLSQATSITNPKLLKCKEISENIQRLKCFDDAMATVTKPPKSAIKKEISNNTLESSFGKTHINTKEEDEFNTIESIIKSAKRNKRKKWVLELENNQIWMEKGGDKMASFKKGDSIIIKRGIMNSFKLKKIGTKRRITVKRMN